MGKNKLSIIIPAYNAENYLPQLLACLDKQMIPGVEVIIIDDGSKVPVKTDYKWAQVIRQENGGASAARNTGLDNAKGEYIVFIDADDLVADNYIDMIKAKIAEKCDHGKLSGMGGRQPLYSEKSMMYSHLITFVYGIGYISAA